MRHYEVIYHDVTDDKFFIKDKNGMRNFYDIVVSEKIKNELEEIGIQNVKYIPMKALNHTTGETIKNLYKLDIKNIIFYFDELDPGKIPNDFDIARSSETPCKLFVSERVKNIFIKNGLTHYKYIPL